MNIETKTFRKRKDIERELSTVDEVILGPFNNGDKLDGIKSKGDMVLKFADDVDVLTLHGTFGNDIFQYLQHLILKEGTTVKRNVTIKVKDLKKRASVSLHKDVKIGGYVTLTDSKGGVLPMFTITEGDMIKTIFDPEPSCYPTTEDTSTSVLNTSSKESVVV